MDNKILKFDLSPKDIRIKNILNKEFLELDIYAISDIYPNRNDTAFTKESMVESKDTCYNKPILGSFDIYADDFREHNGREKYDKEFETEYWDCNNANDEKILGLIRESDTVEVVEEKSRNWLKISCALWTYYTYKQVKKLLKSSTKKVSVEVLVTKYHYDNDGIMIIDKFTLTGITILGDKVSEGIPNAHLNVLDLLNKDTYSQQVKCLTFAYKQNLNNPKMEGKRVTYMEKYKFLESRLADVFPKDENDCINFTLCDFSDDSVVIYCWSEGKHYKIDYTVNEDNVVSFDFENKSEVISTFKEFSEKTVDINGEAKNIEELSQMFAENNEKYSNLEKEYNDYKTDMSSKVFSVTIDEQEYNIEQLQEKYNSDIQAKDEKFAEDIKLKNEEVEKINGDLAQFKSDLENMTTKFNSANEELEGLKTKIKMEQEKDICERGCQLAEDEEDMDDEDRKEIKEKCKNNKYSSVSEVEDDIAKAVYKVHKNRKQNNSFKSNIPNPQFSNETNKDVFGRLQDFSGK